MSEMVHLRIPEGLYKSIEKLSEEMGFKSVQEFVRQAVRDQVFEYEKQLDILWLRREQGSLKGKIKRLTEAERAAVFQEFIREDSSKLLRKYGLDKL